MRPITWILKQNYWVTGFQSKRFSIISIIYVNFPDQNQNQFET